MLFVGIITVAMLYSSEPSRTLEIGPDFLLSSRAFPEPKARCATILFNMVNNTAVKHLKRTLSAAAKSSDWICFMSFQNEHLHARQLQRLPIFHESKTTMQTGKRFSTKISRMMYHPRKYIKRQ